MKNFLYVLALIALIWLVKLSYDSVLLKNQLLAAQHSLSQNEQVTANLNDQLIALQRKSSDAIVDHKPSASQKQAHVESTEIVGLSPMLLLKQQFTLVKFALEQQQYIYAVEQLNLINQAIEQYNLADTLKTTLHDAIQQDQTAIQQYVSSRHIQEKQLAEALRLIERSLDQETQYSELKMTKDEQRSVLSQWFKLDRVDQNIPVIVQRKLILQQVQLQLVSAQQALVRGELLEYQSILDLMIGALKSLPDAYSSNLRQKLIKLKQTKMSPIPKLSSLSILES